MKLTLHEQKVAGAKLRESRESQVPKCTMRALAAKAGVRHSLLGRIENGTQGAPQSVLSVYASVCGLDRDALFLEWGFVPDDVFRALQSRPELCGQLRRELSVQG